MMILGMIVLHSNIETLLVLGIPASKALLEMLQWHLAAL